MWSRTYCGVGRLGDRAAVAQHQDVAIDALGRVVHRLHAPHRFVAGVRAVLRADACPWWSGPCAGSRMSAPALAMARGLVRA